MGELTKLLEAAISEGQNLLNALAAHLSQNHPTAAADPATTDLINKLQSNVNTLSNAHTTAVEGSGSNGSDTVSGPADGTTDTTVMTAWMSVPGTHCDPASAAAEGETE